MTGRSAPAPAPAPAGAGAAGRLPGGRYRSTRPRTVAVALACSVALLTGCTAADSATQAGSTAGTATPSGAPPASPARTAPGGVVDQIPEIIRAVEPSVVTIFTQGGLGSGVIYREDGIIVTNEHVVRGAQQVQVAFADGRRVEGRVLAADVGTDLAVVRVERAGLPAATFQTKLPQVGDLALALGSPLGFEGTATAGIISGLSREIPGSAQQSTALVDLIQTDAPISPGNSGGALVSADREVIGINDAYIPPAAGAVAIGFAIPSATVVDVVEQLLTNGEVRSAFVGIQPGRITRRSLSSSGCRAPTGCWCSTSSPTARQPRPDCDPGTSSPPSTTSRCAPSRTSWAGCARYGRTSRCLWCASGRVTSRPCS